MTPVQKVVVVFTILSALMWLWELYAIIKTGKTIPLISKIKPKHMINPPKISVIIPACNEEKTIEQAMHSRLQENYPNMEFILIDDRSTDNTRAIATKIADQDDRVELVCINELPEGWIGKVHALYRGTQHASGDWILFSDADVHVKNGTMNRVIDYCLEHQVDHLCLLPEFYSGKVIVDTTVNVFIKALLITGTSWRVRNPKSRAYAGAGAFNLVRTAAFKQTDGFQWLKMELVDDVSLGLLMKRINGFQSDILNAREWVSVKWYTNFRDMKIGIGRALYAGIGNCMAIPLMIMAVLGFMMDMVAYVAIIPMGIPWLPVAGAALIILSLIVSVLAARLTERSIIPALLLPIGNTIAFLLTIRAAVLGAIRGGIIWRGTFYAKKDLQKGRRFRF
jgi:Glycosyl transferase family 2